MGEVEGRELPSCLSSPPLPCPLPGLLMLISGRNSLEREIALGICIQTQAAASGFVIGLLM